MTAARVDGWSLEVVRGKDLGRVYALNGEAVVLGNDPGPGPGINLADQEGNSPRRMAANQARLDCLDGALVVRDLDSPGGTFINRQRLLPDQARPLSAGDVIQLGGVQLRLVAASKSPPMSAPPLRPPTVSASGPINLRLPSGTTCRSWDDVLAISAQRWNELRDDLTTGRLAASLIAIGQGALAPSPETPGSPDERLDAWIASLPTTRASTPDLDLHPATLTVRATPGGATTRRKVRVANVGYRLLRATARIEPDGTPWLTIAPGFAGKPFVTAEGIDLPIDVTSPESFTGPLSAALVVESNGGTRRVKVVLEPPAPTGEPFETEPPTSRESDLNARLARLSVPTRLITASLIAAGLRLVIALVAGSSALSLTPISVVLALVGLLAGALVAWR
ncbi:MAG: FHA domain-containing protein, partial [Isosphaeraceae bacterium]